MLTPRKTYFSPEEVKGLNAKLVQRLEDMRHFLQTPVRFTETVASGGSHVKDTAHAGGWAVDGTIRSSKDKSPYTFVEQLKIAWAAGKAGFERVGIYDRHFHVDVDPSKPSPAVWRGVSK